jgi:IS30 family transposase
MIDKKARLVRAFFCPLLSKRSRKHLNAEERNAIHRGRPEGLSLRTIARELGRPASTVAREVARNLPGSSYDAVAAERGCRRRRRRGGRKLAPGTPLWNPVVMDLCRG